MKRKMRSNREKLEIVLSGINGMKVSTICNQYVINQSQCYAWRDQFLSKAETVFDADKKNSRMEKLMEENKEYREVIADPTLELKKCKIMVRGCYKKVTMRNAWLLNRNYHHFFPKAFLQNNMISNDNSIVNVTLVSDYLNKRRIAATPPLSIYRWIYR